MPDGGHPDRPSKYVAKGEHVTSGTYPHASGRHGPIPPARGHRRDRHSPRIALPVSPRRIRRYVPSAAAVDSARPLLRSGCSGTYGESLAACFLAADPPPDQRRRVRLLPRRRQGAHRAGRAPRPQLDVLSPLDHPGPARPRVPGRPRRGPAARQSTARRPADLADLPRGPRTVHRTVAASPASAIQLHWSQWRRRHQAIARACHYRRRVSDDLTGDSRSSLLTGWLGGVCLVVTVLFRCALWSDGMAWPPLTCRFPPDCNACGHNSVTTSGNAALHP
jgi:hypothetical protein